MNRKIANFVKENGYFIFPKMIQLEITRRCPFNCTQCYKKNLHNQDMDYNYIKDVLEKALKNGTILITLNGGEPLLYPCINDLLRYVGEIKISANIFSSGFNITEEIIQLLKIYININFYISLNGSTQEVNCLSREGYDTALAAMKLLSENGVSYGMNWVARHDNISDFPNLLRLCRSYNVSILSITSNKLTGLNEIQSPMVKEDILKLSQYINNRSELLPHIYIESCFSVLSTLIKANKNSFSAHCYAGITNCTINCDGTFQPCTHLHYPEKFENIQDYWNDSQVLKSLRDTPPNKLAPCNNCVHNNICSLCRAMCIETHNDLMAGTSECLNIVPKNFSNAHLKGN